MGCRAKGPLLGPQAAFSMLVFGTANPVGYGGEGYEGLYFTDGDIDSAMGCMLGIPVKIEHSGGEVGKVVSAWKHNGRMDLVLELNSQTIEGQFGKEFVKRGMCKDLSLGYNVQINRSKDGFLRASNKRVVEVSLVKTGARDNCHIRGWSSSSSSSSHQHHHSASATAAVNPMTATAKRAMNCDGGGVPARKRPAVGSSLVRHHVAQID